jgi:hypothetical protein
MPGHVVFYLAALGRPLADGRHDLVSGPEGLGVFLEANGGRIG